MPANVISSWTVGPGGANLQIANAEIIAEVGHRWKDFSKQVENYQTMTVFGSNILSTEGSTWQRHRKITAPPFNERNSGYVFSPDLS
jgi:cytochrome P450